MNHFALVVDDEAFNRNIIRKILEKLKYKVIEATNGKEAVDIFLKNNQKFSLITMDYNMPIMDGVEAIKEIRNFNKEVYIIGISAAALSMQEQLKNQKNISIFSKPLDNSKLEIFLFALKD
jgi:CheY-like chemotaxis protein